MHESSTTAAYITGASRGIGRLLATALADSGERVVGFARPSADLESLRDLPTPVLPIATDVSDPGSVSSAFAEAELDGTGVAAICIHPGFVRTPMIEHLAHSAEGTQWLPSFGEHAEEYLIQRAAIARARSERQIVEAVTAARSKRLSRQRIGELPGTSAQAAQHRYGHLVETA